MSPLSKDDPPLDVLLQQFKHLSSKDMVMVRRVSKHWLLTINRNKVLWRKLILHKDQKWEPQILDLFDRNSGSTLEQVSIQNLGLQDIRSFMDNLERSKHTLKILEVQINLGSLSTAKLLNEFPALVDLRVYDSQPFISVARFKEGVRRNEVLRSQNSSKLQVVWLKRGGALFMSRLEANLTSLVIEEARPSGDWREVLEPISQTIKHLLMVVKVNNEDAESPPREFPSLELLELGSSGAQFPRLPPWMLIPYNSTLRLLNSQYFQDLPTVANIWSKTVYDWGSLERKLPLLRSIRLEVTGSYELGRLLSALIERNSNVTASLEVAGIRMERLKKIEIPFSSCTILEKLRELVEEVIDLETLSGFMEVEI